MSAPCEPYITHDELAGCCETVQTESSGDDPADTLLARQAASSFLFYATGQQFPGICEVFLRPCWECSPCTSSGPPWQPTMIDGHWFNQRCNKTSCACSQRASVSFGDYDVREVVDVFVDGVALAATEYNVVGHHTLVRKTGEWPTCQEWGNPAFPELAVGPYDNTWGVQLRVGQEAPAILKAAAMDLACHFQDMCGEDCNTCNGALSFAVSDGNMDLSFQDILPWVFTGIPRVDFAVRVLNPYGFNRTKARIWSPEANRAVNEGV